MLRIFRTFQHIRYMLKWYKIFNIYKIYKKFINYYDKNSKVKKPSIQSTKPLQKIKELSRSIQNCPCYSPETASHNFLSSSKFSIVRKLAQRLLWRTSSGSRKCICTIGEITTESGGPLLNLMSRLLLRGPFS